MRPMLLKTHGLLDPRRGRADQQHGSIARLLAQLPIGPPQLVDTRRAPHRRCRRGTTRHHLFECLDATVEIAGDARRLGNHAPHIAPHDIAERVVCGQNQPLLDNLLGRVAALTQSRQQQQHAARVRLQSRDRGGRLTGVAGLEQDARVEQAPLDVVGPILGVEAQHGGTRVLDGALRYIAAYDRAAPSGDPGTVGRVAPQQCTQHPPRGGAVAGLDVCFSQACTQRLSDLRRQTRRKSAPDARDHRIPAFLHCIDVEQPLLPAQPQWRPRGSGCRLLEAAGRESERACADEHLDVLERGQAVRGGLGRGRGRGIGARDGRRLEQPLLGERRACERQQHNQRDGLPAQPRDGAPGTSARDTHTEPHRGSQAAAAGGP